MDREYDTDSGFPERTAQTTDITDLGRIPEETDKERDPVAHTTGTSTSASGPAMLPQGRDIDDR